MFKSMLMIFSSCMSTLSNISQVIIEDSKYLLISILSAFAFLVIAFFFFYVFIHHYQLQNISYYKDKRIIGGKNYLPAFKISDSLKEIKVIEAKNDLLLQSFGDRVFPKWSSFSQDRSLQRTFPAEANHWDEFNDLLKFGQKPSEMVEKIFEKYGAVTFRISNYHDNNIENILPFKVIEELYQLDVSQTNLKIQEFHQLNTNDNFHLRLMKISAKIRDNVFNQRSEISLGQLRNLLQTSYQEAGVSSDLGERFKEIFYGEILSIFGTYQVQSEFNFNNLDFLPTHFDLFYLSLMNSTSNPPQDVVGVISSTRVLCWIQVTIAYFLLAGLVAVILKIFKIA